MSCEINLLFKRFSSGKGQITGLTTYYIAQMPQNAPRASLVSGPHDLAKNGELLRPATISPCTITMNLDAIICFMIDQLTRAPDKDVHVPSVGSKKYPSYNVDGIHS